VAHSVGPRGLTFERLTTKFITVRYTNLSFVPPGQTDAWSAVPTDVPLDR